MTKVDKRKKGLRKPVDPNLPPRNQKRKPAEPGQARCTYGGGACDLPLKYKGLCRFHYNKQYNNQFSKEEQEIISRQKKQEEADKRKIEVLSKLSPEQMEKLFLTPCKNRQELMNFVKFFFGLHLPDTTVSRHADINPFDVLWLLYQATVLNKDIGATNVILCGGRGSGKTLVISISQLLAVIHGKRDVVHVGAILSQAQRCYQYVQGFYLNSKIRPIVSPPSTPEDLRMLKKDTMHKSVINTGGRDNTIEILPCTLKAVNGPHVSYVSVDEVDTLQTGEGMRAYKDISGMLDSRDGKRPIRVDISTRKTRHGLMNQMMENAEKQGKLLKRWTVLEFTERCPDARSGTMKQNYFVDSQKASVLKPEDYSKLPESQKKEYIEHDMYIGCGVCPLAPYCLGDAKKQTSKSPMLKSLNEVAAKALVEGPDWTISQLFNLKPSAEGIVFKEFDQRTHVKNWNQMWALLTGTDYPGVCDHDMFIKKCHAMGLQAYGGVDWGWSNPSTLVVFFVDKKDNIYIVRCDGATYTSNAQWIHHMKTKWHSKYKVSLYFPDAANPGDVQEMNRAGLTSSDKTSKCRVESGVQVIKKWLRAPGSVQPKLFLAEETCKPLTKEFELFHYETSADGEATDKFAKESDHWLDALRYAMESIFGGTQAVLSSNSMESLDTTQIVNSRGEYLKPPTPEEWARVNNITLRPESSMDKLGKIGRLSELESDGDDEEDNSGGFTWSF